MNRYISKKVIIKDGYIKKDGTAALYMQVFINGKRKRFPMNIYVKPKSFDRVKQKVKGGTPVARDLNLLIKNEISLYTGIETEYRLRKQTLTMDALAKELEDPDIKISFLKFYKSNLEDQYKTKQIQKSTYKQQCSTYNKLKSYKPEIFFSEIDKDFLKGFIAHLKVEKNNSPNTISSTLKNFKKYLHLANEARINTSLHFSEVKVKKHKGNREFLDEDEIKTLYKYYKQEFLPEGHRNVLSKFLFSCFTGLRISDVQKLTRENFIGDFLVFVSSKTSKMQRLKMSKSALSFVNKEGEVFNDEYTDQTINKILKAIAKNCAIQKLLTFHVSRHTFATQFLIKGGEIRVLQKILGHYKIDTTMIYVHVVEEHINDQIENLDVLIDF